MILLGIIFTLAGIYGFYTLAVNALRMRKSSFGKAFSSWSVLFVLYILTHQTFQVLLLREIFVWGQMNSFFRCFRTSNHVIISFDILFFFSMLMLILYHTFKLEKSLLVR